MYCLKLMKNGQKLACGTSEGPVVVFDWDWFGDYKDRILGHPGAVNTLAKYNDNYLISGCEDGQIRFISLYPKYIKSLLGNKTEKRIKNKTFNEISKIDTNKDIAVDLEEKEENLSGSESEEENLIQAENITEKKDDSESDEIEEFSDENSDKISNLSEDEDEIKEKNETKDFDLIPDGDFDKVQKKDDSSEDHVSKDKEEELEEGNDNVIVEENSDFSSSSEEKKKKKSKKCDTNLKLKVLGKKRNSDWIIDKEKRKHFFNEL